MKLRARRTLAPCLSACWMVGSASSMRWVLDTRPSLMGTLKSTRASTRLPLSSTLSMESFAAIDEDEDELLLRENSTPKRTTDRTAGSIFSRSVRRA
jgi:hypothetical protein